MKVRDLINHTPPPTASPEESAGRAWERMHELKVDHLVVVHEGDVVGVVSRHDLGGPSGGSHRRMGRTVGNLMHGDLVTVTPETSVRRAVSLMRHHGVGCLPVLRNGKLVGLVSVGQLLELLEQSV